MRLSSLGLVHIHRDFEVDMYKAMGVFVSAKTRKADFGQLRLLLAWLTKHLSFINIASIEG
jgi:hypothetical protein